jgi:hypothetical protein
MEGIGSGSVQIMADPDPGGPEIYGSGSTLLLVCSSGLKTKYFFLKVF